MRIALTLLATVLTAAAARGPIPQGASRVERERGLQMLADVRKDIEKHYYDATYRGIDLTAHFAKAEPHIRQAANVNEIIAVINDAVDALGDSHTYLIPPGRNVTVDYGWTMMAIGDRAFIASVSPRSDAARQGVARGDELLQLNAAVPTRQNVHALNHLYRLVRLQKQQHLRLRTPDGAERELDVSSTLTPRRFIDFDALVRELEADVQSLQHRVQAIGSDVLVWQMPAFFGDDREIGRIMNKARACKALVLDLRGNGGGLEDVLLSLTRELFDRDVHVSTDISRKGTERRVAKGRKGAFAGQLVVLVDSRSASAAEMLARIVQLERRGTVIGDRTAGMVMGSLAFGHAAGGDSPYFYGVSVTVVDVRMSDGNSLEGVGVTPDAIVLPKAADLARHRDPALATAVRLAGATLTPEEAARLFPTDK